MKNNMVNYYKALANPVRLAIFMHIAKQSEGFVPTSPKKESCVTEISKTLHIAQPTVSNHLRVLKQAGLIKSVESDTHCYQYITKHAAQSLLAHSQFLFDQAHNNSY